MRFTVALMLLQQPADGLLLSAETTCYLYDIRCTIFDILPRVVGLYEIRYCTQLTVHTGVAG